jgi:hypothetical protein
MNLVALSICRRGRVSFAYLIFSEWGAGEGWAA